MHVCGIVCCWRGQASSPFDSDTLGHQYTESKQPCKNLLLLPTCFTETFATRNDWGENSRVITLTQAYWAQPPGQCGAIVKRCYCQCIHCVTKEGALRIAQLCMSTFWGTGMDNIYVAMIRISLPVLHLKCCILQIFEKLYIWSNTWINANICSLFKRVRFQICT